MTYSRQEIDAIIIDSFEELTYKNKCILLSGFKNPFANSDKNTPTLIKSLSEGVYNKVKGKFSDEAYRSKILSSLKAKSVTCITFYSENYPEDLKQIPNPPIVLYCKGNLSLLKTRRFAIVGSRRTQPNVLRECLKISGELTDKFTVVTGMADGADSAAIEGAIESGKIISVLAYGFDYAYPAVSAKLIQKVERCGLLLSEYPPEIPPKNYQFPVRNRIIAGLSDAVLVVSAGIKSGALITANYAEEYGKQVMAFPYSMGVTYGAGCNFLIKKGANLVENTPDIFEAFGLEFEPPEEKTELNGEEQIALDAIREAGEAFAPEIAEKLNKLPHQIIPVLSSLEIKGLIIRLGGNRYAAI
ncbi:MAG: DNA-processing protein DprA [Clostridiales bacterium]|nr:DNA-processing protein DprA [Clostridiales bacterium]